MDDKCVFCRTTEASSYTGFKNKWICDKCFGELYGLFKTYYYVKRVSKLTDQIEDYLKEKLKVE